MKHKKPQPEKWPDPFPDDERQREQHRQQAQEVGKDEDMDIIESEKRRDEQDDDE